MIDIAITVFVIVILAGITGVIAWRSPRSLQPWIWIGLLEYLLCSSAQLFYTHDIYKGGDAILYAETGVWLAKLLDANFSFAAPELLSLLLQQPSVFDQFVYGGGGGNTGSMHAISGWVIFICRGSVTAAHVLVAGLAYFGTVGIFSAFRPYVQGPPYRLFIATVLFPSVAFWTSTLHKEAFGVMGIGALLIAWRGLYSGHWIRAVFCAPLGVLLIFLFRAPALAPVFLGLVVFFVVTRLQSTRGVEMVLLGPVYLGLALLGLTVGMVALTRVAPALGLDRLGGTVATQQQVWALARSGAAFGAVDGEEGPQTLGAQIIRVPLALLNALLRPQIFDVHNVTALLSAIEMTAITYFIIRVLRQHGLGGTLTRIQRSPFLLMCALTTLVGCAFVGLVTFNFGSLARYRVPFLPFYGALLTGLLSAKVPAEAKQPTVPIKKPIPSKRPIAARIARKHTASSMSTTSSRH